MLLPHILHWLPMTIRINKVIRDLPFFFCPSNFILYFLTLLHAQNMTDDVEICKHTIFFHLSSCLHMLFPPLGMFILPQNFARSCAGGFVRPLWITHRQQPPPTLKLSYMALSSMTVSCTKHPTYSYLWYKGPWATGGQCPWLVIIEEMSLSYRIRNLISLQQIFAELMNKWINSKGSCGLIVMGLEYPAE